MAEGENRWFESIEAGGKRVYTSKFLRSDFSVSPRTVKEEWQAWTSDEKRSFAAAFSARIPREENDERVLDFLMDHGNSQVWSSIALSVTRHRDRARALKFLLAQITAGQGPFANYYQALAVLAAPESVPALVEAFARHSEQIGRHPTLEARSDRFVYLDCISCCATLFALTRQQEYRIFLKRMLEHPDKTVRKMATMVQKTRGIDLSYTGS